MVQLRLAHYPESRPLHLGYVFLARELAVMSYLLDFETHGPHLDEPVDNVADGHGRVVAHSQPAMVRPVEERNAVFVLLGRRLGYREERNQKPLEGAIPA